ncbi:hypothetical protein BJ741DRAFT_670914 [Chytriomyces cf. hyalinus JEL632]|nr:hypothetical protein BJ741DRAFT_670914 [Chytriomyces cf. hyalinus JEL632]
MIRPEDGMFVCEHCQVVFEQEKGTNFENDLSRSITLPPQNFNVFGKRGKDFGDDTANKKQRPNEEDSDDDEVFEEM